MINKKVLLWMALFIKVSLYAQSQNRFITQADSCMNVYDYKNAIEFYKKAISQKASPQNLYKLCLAYNPEVKNEYLESKSILKKLTITKISDSLLLAKIHFELGNRLRANYQYDSAEVYLKKSMGIGNKYQYFEPLQKITRLYTNKGDFDLALKYALETTKAAEKTNDTDLLARSYLDRGLIYKSMNKNDPKALQYFETALKLAKSTTNYKTLSFIYESISNYYANIAYQNNDTKLIKKALGYMELAYDASKKCNDYIGMAHNSMALASLYSDLNNYIIAEKKYKDAGKILISIDSPSNKAEYFYYYGDFLFMSGKDKNKGLAYLDSAANIWGKAGLKYYQSLAMRSMALGYEDIGNLKKALELQKQFNDLDVAIRGEKTQKQLQELNIKYETEKKDAQLAQQKVQLLEKQQRITQIALSAALILLVLMALFAYYRHKQRQKISKMESEFEQATQQLESFNYSVSHDLRHPLINAQHSLEELEKDIKSNDKHLNLISKVQNSIATMNEIIDTMLLLASIERNSLQVTEINTKDLVNDIIDDFAIDSNNIIYVGELPTIKADVRLLRQVFVNLLSNAIKYSSPKNNPKVEILSENKNGQIQFIISDNGIGFDERFSNKLFQLFGRLHADINGIGVGLVIVKKIIEKHGGKVWATAKQNQGAKFMFELPN